jgi:hypothetical protein
MVNQYSIKPTVTIASSDPANIGHTRYMAYNTYARRPIDCGENATIEDCEAFMREHYPDWEQVPDSRPMTAQEMLELHAL